MNKQVLLNFTGIFLLLMTFGATQVFSQTTEFSYQGFLSDNSASANGNFDFEFRLFDIATGGAAIGTIQRPNVTVTNGVFSVVLDFGAFPSANRFLEIAVRKNGTSVSTTLAPRSKLLSTPYSTNAISAQNSTNAVNATNSVNSQNAANAINANTAQNALQLGGTAANQFVLTGDARLSNARNPLPGSANYVQNSTTTQAATNFNISGNGTSGGTLTGNIVRANSQFNIGSDRVLSNAGTGNIFAGKDAGLANSGLFNSFVGVAAGISNTTGFANSFYGSTAGGENTTGGSNSFFGLGAGNSNLTGNANSFYGVNAGFANTASNNSFFGASAGLSNTIGGENAFFGFEAGRLNVTGSRNSIFGDEAGESNVSGANNSYFGRSAGKLSTGSFNTYIGALAGSADTTGSRNTFVGNQSGLANLTGTGNSFFGKSAGFGNTEGLNNTAIGTDSDVSFGLINATAIGAEASVEQSNSLVLGSISGVNSATATIKVGIGTTTPDDRLHVNGVIRVDQLGLAAGLPEYLCRNPSNQIARCLTVVIGGGRAGTPENIDESTAVNLLEIVKQQQIQLEEQKKKSEAQQIQLDKQAAAIAKLALELQPKTTDAALESNIKRNKKQ